MRTNQHDNLLAALKLRFETHMLRHPDLTWPAVEKALLAKPAKLASVAQMESTGGEPDVVVFGGASAGLTFCDCSTEAPLGRRSLCYDRAALDARKVNKPKGSAMELAMSIGVEMLTEVEYRALQKLGAFDLKSSSWIKAPEAVRSLGGALFCDRRYDQVFVYHNGAESYYAARGFRAMLQV